MSGNIVGWARPPCDAFALACALALAACNGGSNGTSTGNPNDGSDKTPTLPGGDGRDVLPGDAPGPTTGDAASFCKGEPTVLESSSTRIDYGFSADDVLAFAGGAHDEAIVWHDNDIATLGPEKGEHRVAITVAYDGGEIRWMTPKTAQDGGDLGGPEPAIAPAPGPTVDLPAVGGCMPWLEIDVRVTVKSDGGALDESFDATLRSRNELLASLWAAPDPDELGGAFAPEQILQPGYELVQLDLELNFTPFGVSGRFNGVFQVQRGDSVGAAAGANPFAEIGRAGCSGYASGFAVEIDDMVEGASGADMLALVKGAHDLAVTWSDGTSTTATLSFAPTQDGACVLLDNKIYGGASLNIDGQLALTTADGRVAARWRVGHGRSGSAGGLSQGPDRRAGAAGRGRERVRRRQLQLHVGGQQQTSRAATRAA